MTISDGGLSSDPSVPAAPAPAGEPTSEAGAAPATIATLADTIVDATTPDSGPENRPADGAVLRYGTVTAVGAGGNAGKVQTDTTGTAWVAYDAAYGPRVNDLVYLFQQGPVVHVGGKLGGTQPTAPPVGVIHPYAGSVAPAGWLSCNGAAVSRTTYAELFAVCGTTFGVGNGSTTFNVPNLTDRTPTGIGSLYVRGETGGAETRTLTTSNLPAHTHTGTSHTHGMGHDHDQVEHSHTVYVGTAGTYAGAGTTDGPYPSSAGSHSTSQQTPNIVAFTGSTDAGGTGSTGSTGSGTAVNIMSPYLGILYILRALP